MQNHIPSHPLPIPSLSFMLRFSDIYCRDEPVDFFGRANKERETSPEQTKEKEPEKPPILYLKLSEKRETSSSFAKGQNLFLSLLLLLFFCLPLPISATPLFINIIFPDDLWIISADPKFSGNGLFFFAKSVFHGPARSGLMEVCTLLYYPLLPSFLSLLFIFNSFLFQDKSNR